MSRRDDNTEGRCKAVGLERMQCRVGGAEIRLSRIVARPLKPEVKLSVEGGNDGLLTARWAVGQQGNEMDEKWK
jgi:hypothetical protein